MVTTNIDITNYQFTTKNVLENFKIKEKLIPIKDSKLKFFFKGNDAFLQVDEIEYRFEATGSLISFLHRISINSALISSLTEETLETVVNERLQNFASGLNIIIDQNTDNIIAVISMSSALVSWHKIVTTICDVFSLDEEKNLFLTTFTGLGISIKMNSDNDADLDVIRIEPQTPSSIPIYRGMAAEHVPTKGYDEEEILRNLADNLRLIIQLDPNIKKNYSDLEQ